MSEPHEHEFREGEQADRAHRSFSAGDSRLVFGQVEVIPPHAIDRAVHEVAARHDVDGGRRRHRSRSTNGRPRRAGERARPLPLRRHRHSPRSATGVGRHPEIEAIGMTEEAARCASPHSSPAIQSRPTARHCDRDPAAIDQQQAAPARPPTTPASWRAVGHADPAGRGAAAPLRREGRCPRRRAPAPAGSRDRRRGCPSAWRDASQATRDVTPVFHRLIIHSTAETGSWLGGLVSVGGDSQPKCQGWT